MSSNSTVTFPLIVEDPMMSNSNVLLSGVNLTLNNDAVKPELAWHEFRELDVIMRMAEASGRRLESDTTAAAQRDAAYDGRMLWVGCLLQ